MSLRERLSARVSLAARITVLTTMAVGATIAVISIVVFFLVRMQLIHDLDDGLLQRAHAAAKTDVVVPATIEGYPPGYLAAADIKIAVITHGHAVATKADTDVAAYTGPAELAVANGDVQQSLRTVSIEGVDYRVVAVPAGRRTALVLALSLASADATLDRLGLVLWVIGLSGVLIAGVAGWGVATNSLRPVRRLTDAAERVARTEELRPIAVTGDDELARLTISFNAMLAALEGSLQRQRQLVADAGHELRTPLTSLRTNVELLTQADTQGGLSAKARGELLGDIRAQVEELSTLVGDLVELARDEPLVRGPEPVDLAESVATSVRRVQLRAPGIAFDVRTEPWLVTGDAQLLERAVTNLLDNAAKWSPPLGTVGVELRNGVLSVADSGPGINEEDLPHVFERFYRSSEARTLPGSGLGLAIVEQTARRHGGHITAGRASSGGALFQLWVPGRRPTDARAYDGPSRLAAPGGPGGPGASEVLTR